MNEGSPGGKGKMRNVMHSMTYRTEGELPQRFRSGRR